MTTEPDPAVVYERLKAETAQLLRIDVNGASLLENLQIDLVSLLRLQIDDLQGRVLNGEQVDLGRLSTAVAMLQKLLPQSLIAPAAGPDFSGAREELARLFEQRAEAIAR
jgi:hypothetical protein